MAAEAKAYLEQQGLSEAMTAAVKQVITERPADAKKRLGEILIAMSAKSASGGGFQSAFVFTKPHANTQPVRDMVTAKFKEKFGEDWATALAEGRAFNALGACEKLGLSPAELNELWVASKDKLVKLGGGFYCCLLEPEGKDAIYVFNAFFMAMRGKFTAVDASLHYYVVKFAPSTLSWGDFRGQVLGPTDPGKAPATSLRGMLMADWEKLGLKGAPNTTDNGVHASASPFEGLAERMNWLQVPVAEDEFGKALLDAGLSEEMIKAWSVDPQVNLGDKKGSIFDTLEDIDKDECLAKCAEIAKLN